MHETGLTRGLMKAIERLAAEQGATRVVSVKVWLGALSQISPDHFREHFEEDSAGTLADGARLDVELSEDILDQHAQDVLLKSVELA